jgi:hypothetical protein
MKLYTEAKLEQQLKAVSISFINDKTKYYKQIKLKFLKYLIGLLLTSKLKALLSIF